MKRAMMKRIFLLPIVLVILVSLSGCYARWDNDGRDGRHDGRGHGHDERH